VLPGVVRHTFIIFGIFTTPTLCPPDTKSWRRHCSRSWKFPNVCGQCRSETSFCS